MKDRFKFRVWCYEHNRYEKTAMVVSEMDGYLFHNTTPSGIIEQCTGVKDKNGKLIYCGDIIEARLKSHWSVKTEGVVVFNQKDAIFCNLNLGGMTPLFSISGIKIKSSVHDLKSDDKVAILYHKHITEG